MGTFGKVLAGAAIGMVGLALLGALIPGIGMAAAGCCLPACLTALCCGAGAMAASNRSSASESTTNQNLSDSLYDGTCRFETEVEKAKASVKVYARNSQFLPHSGEYGTTYIDGNDSHNAILHLKFSDVGSGYKILGEGSDIDGVTEIQDGFANYQGMAWWKELTIAGDVGLEILSKGKFDFVKRTFIGSWHSNSARSGMYTQFKAICIPNQEATHIYESSPTESYVPVVSGTIVAAQNPAQNPHSIQKVQGTYINY